MSAQPLPALLAHLAPLLDHYGYLAVGGFIGLEDFGYPRDTAVMYLAPAFLAGLAFFISRQHRREPLDGHGHTQGAA